MGSADLAKRMLASSDGAVRRADLVRAEVSRGWLRRRLDEDSLREPFPGVISEAVDSHSRLVAALVYAGDGARLSHTTAAHLFGLPVRTGDDVIHVAVPHGHSRGEAPGLVLHETTHAEEVMTGPLRVVPLPRTLLDLTDPLGLDEVRFLATAAVHGGHVTATDLRGGVRPPRRLTRAWAMLLEEVDAGAASGGEARYWRAVKDSGLPLPELNAPFTAGATTYYVDAVWRAFRLGAEIDGHSVHATRAAFAADRTRQNALHAAGLMLIRFAVADVMRDPGGVAEQTRTALLARAHELRLPRRLRLRLEATAE